MLTAHKRLTVNAHPRTGQVYADRAFACVLNVDGDREVEVAKKVKIKGSRVGDISGVTLNGSGAKTTGPLVSSDGQAEDPGQK